MPSGKQQTGSAIDGLFAKLSLRVSASTGVSGMPHGLFWINVTEAPDEALAEYNLVRARIMSLPMGEERSHKTRWLESAHSQLSAYIVEQCEVAGRALVWDVETTALVGEVPIDQMEISVACAVLFDIASGSEELRIAFWHTETARGAPLDLLPIALKHAHRNVAFNGLNFDLIVVRRLFTSYRDFEMAQSRCLDTYAAIKDLSMSLGLNRLAEINGLGSKLENGRQAPVLYHLQRFDQLEEYCFQDVNLLKDLVSLRDIRLPTSDGRVSTTRGLGTLGFGDTRQLKQNTKEWFDARKGLVTASFAPSLLGMGMVRADQAFEILLGTEESSPPTEAMLVGQRREPDIATAAATHLGIEFSETGLHIDHELKWLGASPDRISVDGTALLEIKSVGKLSTPSNAMLIQVQLQLRVSNLKLCYLALSDLSDRLRIFRVARDDDLIEHLISMLTPIHEAALDARLNGTEDDTTLVVNPMASRDLKTLLRESRRFFMTE